MPREVGGKQIRRIKYTTNILGVDHDSKSLRSNPFFNEGGEKSNQYSFQCIFLFGLLSF